MQAQFTLADASGTQHLMWTWGGDFQYQATDQNFVNLDKLLHYVNLVRAIWACLLE